MKYYVLFLILICLDTSMMVVGQDTYVKIPRTRISMIPPEGYQLLPITGVFEKNKFEYISFSELIDGNFYSNSRDFNLSGFEKNGMKLLDLNDTLICGYPAIIAKTITNDSRYNGLMLTFGDSTFSVLITSIQEANNNVLEQKILKSFSSVLYDKSRIYDPFEDVPFEIDTVTTRFKFSRYLSNMHLFTPEGKNIDSLNPVIAILALPHDGTSLATNSEIILMQSRQNGYFGFMTESSKSEEINGTKSLTVYGRCYSNTNMKFFYQRLLLKEGILIMSWCFIDSADEKGIAEVKVFAEKITIKNYP